MTKKLLILLIIYLWHKNTVSSAEIYPEEWNELSISEQKCLEFARIYEQTSNNSKRCPMDVVQMTTNIINAAAEREFPHHVLFGYLKDEDDENEEEEPDYVWLCGGTLISELFVLTAAYCNEHREIVLALLGTFEQQSEISHKEIRGAAAVYDEKADTKYKYNSEARLNVILLVKLNESVSFNHYIKPACLPSVKYDIGTVYTATGFEPGMEYTHFHKRHLLKNELTVNVNCTYKKFDEKTQICTEADTCIRYFGGSPLVIRHQDVEKAPCMYTLVGISSHGNQCFMKNWRSNEIYTRVSAYVKWIECRVWNVGCDLL